MSLYKSYQIQQRTTGRSSEHTDTTRLVQLLHSQRLSESRILHQLQMSTWSTTCTHTCVCAHTNAHTHTHIYTIVTHHHKHRDKYSVHTHRYLLSLSSMVALLPGTSLCFPSCMEKCVAHLKKSYLHIYERYYYYYYYYYIYFYFWGKITQV